MDLWFYVVIVFACIYNHTSFFVQLEKLSVKEYVQYNKTDFYIQKLAAERSITNSYRSPLNIIFSFTSDELFYVAICSQTFTWLHKEWILYIFLLIISKVGHWKGNPKRMANGERWTRSSKSTSWFGDEWWYFDRKMQVHRY